MKPANSNDEGRIPTALLSHANSLPPVIHLRNDQQRSTTNSANKQHPGQTPAREEASKQKSNSSCQREVESAPSPWQQPQGPMVEARTQGELFKYHQKYTRLQIYYQMPNTPKWLRPALSLPQLRRTKAAPAPSATAPILPNIDLGFLREPHNAHEDEDENNSNDMNGTAWNYEDAAKLAKGATPPQSHRPVMPSYTSRNVSGPLAVDTAVSPDQNTNPSPWHRANPHAAPQNNSKTSQYIDKITSENERLRRELRAEKLAREDEAKRVSAARSKAEDSRAEYQHLQVLADANARAIERKDRKLDELKATLEAEVKRRQAAEQRADEALKMLGDTRSETQRQLASAYEMKHLAETNADAARDGFKRITDSYEKQVKAMKDELKELRIQRREDADKIQRQGIISDQLHHEMGRRLRNEDVMTDMMGKYKKEHKKEMDALVAEAERMRTVLPSREKEAAILVQELANTRDKMKWVMAQKQRQEPI